MADRQQLPEDYLARRLKQLRERRGWTQADFASRVAEVGGGLDRAAIGKIEVSKRGVSLNDALLLAAALEVAPINLMTPRERDAVVHVTPRIADTSENVRRWIRGSQPLEEHTDLATFYGEVGEEAWSLHMSGLRFLYECADDLANASSKEDALRAIDLLMSELDVIADRIDPDSPRATRRREQREELRDQLRQRLGLPEPWTQRRKQEEEES